MGYFQVRYDSRVVNYERKLFIRLATGKRAIGKRRKNFFNFRRNGSDGLKPISRKFRVSFADDEGNGNEDSSSSDDSNCHMDVAQSSDFQVVFGKFGGDIKENQGRAGHVKLKNA